MKGAVGFLATGGWVSNLILWFRRLPHPEAKFSHCFRCIGPLTEEMVEVCRHFEIPLKEAVLGDEMCISMEPQGCVLMTLKKQISKKKLVELWLPPLDESKTDNMIFAELRKVKQVYAYVQLLGMIRVTLADWFGIKKENTYSKNEFCSENVHQSLVGPDGDCDLNSECSAELINYDQDSIAPDEVYVAIIKDPRSKEVSL